VPDLEYAVERGIGTILLNRPASRNAFTLEMLEAWTRTLELAQDDPDVRVLVVRGQGEAFCAGIDLRRVQSDLGSSALEHKDIVQRRIQQLPLAMEHFDKPVVASISGPAVGAGLDLALMCDLRLAARSARFSEGYINAGLLPGAGAAYYLPRLLGYAHAFELLLTGEFVDAEEALRIGLVNHVYDDADLAHATYELAARLAAKPPEVARLMKRTLRQSAQTDLSTALDLVSSHMGLVRYSTEAQSAFEQVKAHVAPERS
jgi:enoyl-CoA hydratase/carnithine racemase